MTARIQAEALHTLVTLGQEKVASEMLAKWLGENRGPRGAMDLLCELDAQALFDFFELPQALVAECLVAWAPNHADQSWFRTLEAACPPATILAHAFASPWLQRGPVDPDTPGEMPLIDRALERDPGAWHRLQTDIPHFENLDTNVISRRAFEACTPAFAACMSLDRQRGLGALLDAISPERWEHVPTAAVVSKQAQHPFLAPGQHLSLVQATALLSPSFMHWALRMVDCSHPRVRAQLGHDLAWIVGLYDHFSESLRRGESRTFDRRGLATAAAEVALHTDFRRHGWALDSTDAPASARTSLVQILMHAYGHVGCPALDAWAQAGGKLPVDAKATHRHDPLGELMGRIDSKEFDIDVVERVVELGKKQGASSPLVQEVFAQSVGAGAADLALLMVQAGADPAGPVGRYRSAVTALKARASKSSFTMGHQRLLEALPAMQARMNARKLLDGLSAPSDSPCP